MGNTPVKEATQKYHRNEILSKCRDLFYEKGIENVTSNQIAEYAGYSKRTIYQYFSSIREIVSLLEDGAVVSFTDEISSHAPKSLEDYFQTARTFRLEHPEEFYFLKQLSFSKNNEKDYFYFSEKFHLLISLLKSAYHCALPSVDVPMIIWNTLIYALDTDIPVLICTNLFLHGISSC